MITFLNYRARIEKVLYYDQSIYDRYSYERQIIADKLGIAIKKYAGIKIPILREIDSWDSGVIYTTADRPIPNDILVFLHIYMRSPNVHIKIYLSETIGKVTTVHKARIQSGIEKKNTNNLILFMPICYSKHYKLNYKDRQYITAICFVNVVDRTLDQKFPADRFIVIHFELIDLEDNVENRVKMMEHVANMTNSILSENTAEKMPEYCYPEDIIKLCTSLDKCLEVLIEKQNSVL